MKKMVVGFMLAWCVGTTGVASAGTGYSTSEAVAKYNKFILADSYVLDELYNVADFRSRYAALEGTLAYRVVDRAIWYMENGYFVYGHGLDAYGKYGYEDCSGFTRLVYGDFGFPVTGTSKNYDSVGTKVEGVGHKQVNGKWQLTGIEQLQIGDILTWQQNDHISHVAIYMGTNRDGQPVVIGTRDGGNPTGLGTVDSWSYWWGEKFHSARRVLPAGALQGMAGHTEKPPVTPQSYVLPPQRTIPAWGDAAQQNRQSAVQPSNAMPSEQQTQKQYVVTRVGWVSLKELPKSGSATVGRLNLGEKAELIRKANSYWYEVKWQGKTVYITTNDHYTNVITE